MKTRHIVRLLQKYPFWVMSVSSSPVSLRWNEEKNAIEWVSTGSSIIQMNKGFSRNEVPVRALQLIVEIERGLDKLEPVERKALFFRYMTHGKNKIVGEEDEADYEVMEYSKLAQILGVSKSTAWCIVKRGLAKLKGYLQHLDSPNGNEV